MNLRETFLSLALIYKNALLIFYKKRGMTMAAASSFYVLVSLLPLFLLIARILGVFLGDISLGTEQIFNYTQNFFPNIGIDLIEKLKTIISIPLFAKTPFSFINFILLCISGLTFFNTLWSGLYLLTEDREHLSLKKYFRGIIIISITVLFILITFIIPNVFYYIFKFINESPLIDDLSKEMIPFQYFILFFKNINENFLLFFKSNYFHGVLFLIYFTLFFKFSFSGKVRFKNAAIGGFNFVISILLLKKFFWVYLYYVRSGLVESYGGYYTFILALMWVFFAMCIFFFSACLTYSGLKSTNS